MTGSTTTLFCEACSAEGICSKTSNKKSMIPIGKTFMSMYHAFCDLRQFLVDYKPANLKVFGVCLQERPDGHCNEIEDQANQSKTVVHRYLGQMLFLVCSQTKLGKTYEIYVYNLHADKQHSFTGIEDQKFCLDVPRSSRVLSKENDFIEMEQNSGTIVQRSSAYSTQHGWKSTNLTMADQGNYTCFDKVIFLNLTGDNLTGPRPKVCR